MSKKQHEKNWRKIRETVFHRDQHKCGNCLGRVENGRTLDPDHNVPEGVGGSDRLSNLNTLCRRCHEAKHGCGLAPTIRWQSTGDMNDIEFTWFKHVMLEMIPALGRSFGVRVVPEFGLTDSEDSWATPLGDIRQLDMQLADTDDQYSSLMTHEYM